MAAADTRFHTAYGQFDLRRYPRRRHEPLQAWCAADSLLLDEVRRRGLPGSDVLVANDEQGALCVALQPRALWTDSALSALASAENLARNGRQKVPVSWSTESPPSDCTLVALRVPKQLAYFEYQLAVLSTILPRGAVVLAAGMDKHLSPHTALLLERHIGPTQRHHGRLKARLFSATREQQPARGPADDGRHYYQCDELQMRLCALPNVFSREGLDSGSRLLLQQFHALPSGNAAVLDLACGSGVLGLGARAGGLAQRVVLCDESAQAVASARLNCERLFPGHCQHFSFHHGDGLVDYRGAAVDLILCNPPFHLHHAVDAFAGRYLLGQCAQRLLPAGRLCLVANRHLDYLPTLRRDFARVELIAQNSRFKVLLAHKAG